MNIEFSISIEFQSNQVDLSILLTLFFSVFFFHPLISIKYRELSKDTTIFLRFKNEELESSYIKQRESMSSVPLIASLLVQIVASIYSSFFLPSSAIHFIAIIAPIILIIPIVLISIAESFPMVSRIVSSIFFYYYLISYSSFSILHYLTIISLYLSLHSSHKLHSTSRSR